MDWYDSSTGARWSFADFVVIRDTTLIAKWKIITYSIQYDLDGGYLAEGDDNPAFYTVEDTITLSAPLKDGYAFQGWRLDDGSLITSINKGTAGNLILTAIWSANKNNLSVKSEDTGKGTVSITSGTGYSGESITVTATPIGDCVFEGWYNESTKVSGVATYTFIMPTSDYSLLAHFFTKAEEEERKKNLGIIPAIDTSKGTLTYGLYPQTHVSDDDTISALDALLTPKSNGYYLYNDEYYAKKAANPYGSTCAFNDGTTIRHGASYWFKCEPIEWKILTSGDGTYSLVSTLLLDAHRYGYDSNNYANSEIREWLNDDFLNTAFSLDSSLIQVTSVDNSASTTDSSSNRYACDNTEDKVYLLSYQDYLNADYGFSSNSSRICKPTDYAIANCCYIYNDNGCYWTRSPDSDYDSSAWSFDAGGDPYKGYVKNEEGAVRPALTINL